MLPVFCFLRAIRRPSKVSGHSIDAIFSSENSLHMDRRLTQNFFGFGGDLFCTKQGEMLFFCLPPFDVDFFFEKLRNLLGKILVGLFLVKTFRGRVFVEEFLWEMFGGEV